MKVDVSYLGKLGSAVGEDQTGFGGGVAVGGALEDLFFFLCHLGNGWCHEEGLGGKCQYEGKVGAPYWGVGGGKRPKQLTGARKRYRVGMLRVVQGWRVGG